MADDPPPPPPMADVPTVSLSRPSVKKQAEPKVDWGRLMLMATGCQNEYIQVSDTGVRFMDCAPKGGAPDHVARGHVADAIAAMQEGLPVLFHVEGFGFEQRILKVDNRLSFCYIFSIASRMDNSKMQLLPLHEVRVLTHSEATEVCRVLGIDDSHMTADSTVVVRLGEDPEEDANLEKEELQTKAFVFIAPPQTLLKERLQVCTRAKARVFKARDEDGTGDANAEVKLRMDGVRFKDPLAVYKEPKYVTLEVQFLTAGGHIGGRLVQYRLKLPLPLKKVPEEIARIEAQASFFTAVDRARVMYVLREMSMVHSWARSFKRLHEVDFYTFMAADASAAERRKAQGGDDLSELRKPEAIAHVCQLPTLPGEDHYSKATIRSVLRALQQSMELDNYLIVTKHRLSAKEEGARESFRAASKEADKAASSSSGVPAVPKLPEQEASAAAPQAAQEPGSTRSEPVLPRSSSADLAPTDEAAQRSDKRASTWGITPPEGGSMLGRITSWGNKLF